MTRSKPETVVVRLDAGTLEALDRLATTLAASQVHRTELAVLMHAGRVTRSMVVRLLIARGLEAMAQERVRDMAPGSRQIGRAWDESSRPTGRPRTLEVGSDLDDDLADE